MRLALLDRLMVSIHLRFGSIRMALLNRQPLHKVLMLGRLGRLHLEDGRNDGQRRRLLLGQLSDSEDTRQTTNARVEDILHKLRNRPREEGKLDRRQANQRQLCVRAHLMFLHIFLATQRQVDACRIRVLGRGVGDGL